MPTVIRMLTVAAFAVVLVVFGSGGTRAGPHEEPKPRVIPDQVFKEIVLECNQLIQTPLAKDAPYGVSHQWEWAVRANALLIALAAQNQMTKRGDDLRQLATLRDAALKLYEATQRSPHDVGTVRRLAEVVKRYPDLKADPAARPDPVRFRAICTHDEISILFGGCSGRRGHAVEYELEQLQKQKTPIMAEQTEKIERMAYKVALIGGLLRDFEDMFPASKPDRRAEWVRLANELGNTGWQLAASARDRHAADVRRGIDKLNNACTTCHQKFRD
jgi:cytochrome c556